MAVVLPPLAMRRRDAFRETRREVAQPQCDTLGGLLLLLLLLLFSGPVADDDDVELGEQSSAGAGGNEMSTARHRSGGEKKEKKGKEKKTLACLAGSKCHGSQMAVMAVMVVMAVGRTSPRRAGAIQSSQAAPPTPSPALT